MMSPNQIEEVTVVGAGPSGLSAALALRRFGLRVHVRERRTAPGMRHHGFQGLENWSQPEDAAVVLRSMGIRPEFLLRPVHEVAYFGPSLKKHLVAAKDPLFYLVRRGSRGDSLDQSLARQAQDADVRITYEDTVVAAPSGTVVGVGPSSAMAIAKGIVFKTNAPECAVCVVDPEVAPFAYAYLLVHEGEATLATMLTADFASASSYLQKAIDTFRKIMTFSIEDAMEFGGVGAIDFQAKQVVGGHCRVGECAGAQDPLWGFGIWFALKTGQLAARSLAEGRDYERDYRRLILPHMRRLLVCRWMFERIGPQKYDGFMKAFADSADARGRLRRFYGGSRWLSVLYPLALRNFKAGLREKRCHADDCDCVWCRHGKEALLPNSE